MKHMVAHTEVLQRRLWTFYYLNCNSRLVISDRSHKRIFAISLKVIVFSVKRSIVRITCSCAPTKIWNFSCKSNRIRLLSAIEKSKQCTNAFAEIAWIIWNAWFVNVLCPFFCCQYSTFLAIFVPQKSNRTCLLSLKFNLRLKIMPITERSVSIWRSHAKMRWGIKLSLHLSKTYY